MHAGTKSRLDGTYSNEVQSISHVCGTIKNRWELEEKETAVSLSAIPLMAL